MVKTPMRYIGPITRSAAAKQTKERNSSTHYCAPNLKIRVTRKRTTAPITRSAVARLAQQKEDHKSTRCRITADSGKVVETPIIRNSYRGYGSSSRIDEPVTQKTKTKTIKKKNNKKPFHCIFCNKRAFTTAKPHPSGAVGSLDCTGCGAKFKFRVAANLSCARDVQAALLDGGDDIRWLSAMQGIVR